MSHLNFFIFSDEHSAIALDWLKQHWRQDEVTRFMIVRERNLCSPEQIAGVLVQGASFDSISIYLATKTNVANSVAYYRAKLQAHSKYKVFYLQTVLEERLQKLIDWKEYTFEVRDATLFWEYFERGLACVLLCLFLPMMVVVYFLVKFYSDAGPGLYRQERVGKLGQPFTMLKFRTMRMDAEKDGEVQWASHQDMRATRIGRWLRQTHLDELPQLWQVVQGKMALIGPRPERPQYVAYLSQQIEGYTLRHLVKPGITGLAQVKWCYAGSLAENKEKLSYDLYYIRNRSWWLDIYILLVSANKVFFRNGLVKMPVLFKHYWSRSFNKTDRSPKR